MHALVYGAVQQAKAENRTRLSLAALPARAPNSSNAARALRLRIARLGHGAGLTQFKTCFKPRLQPLYMVAPSWASMLLSMADLALMVHRPPHFSRACPNVAQDDYDNYEFAPQTNL